ncbi:MAG: UDP-N-acetylglucosamine 1-carboxyvinyltransferase [Candidatus Babeliales bacterium]
MATIPPHAAGSVAQEWSTQFIQQLKTEEAASLHIEQSPPLHGVIPVSGAKNAVLVSMASLLLADGKSTLTHVPCSADVAQMIQVLKQLGAVVDFDTDTHTLHVDTAFVHQYTIGEDLMKKMRASVLVMGPLLARFGRADVAMPGGCLLGERPIDFHLKSFAKMGVSVSYEQEYIRTYAAPLKSARIVLPYPSVGATENILMAATLTKGTTHIVNAALEPEVLDLITLLQTMGAAITIESPATICIDGVAALKPVTHQIMADRLEAGALLLAAAITGGTVTIPNGSWRSMDVFLEALDQMGHTITCHEPEGITLVSTREPKAIATIRTSPYPGFPTDLQAPLMAALCLARGKTVLYETVFENRLLHVRELEKMGAQITIDGQKATITGVDTLFGANVIATDIRASFALVLAGMAAQGTTVMSGLNHWRRGYDGMEHKLATLGARISLKTSN